MLRMGSEVRMARNLLNQFARLIPFVMIAWLLVACGAVDAPPEPTETPTAAAAETASTSSADSAAEVEHDDALSGMRLLTIDPDQSEARFLVVEVLLGEDKTVVGVTSQVTGTISVDPADPASAQIGTIIIDARDLTTDSSRRNRSIQRRVLRSVLDENRFITFEPTATDRHRRPAGDGGHR
jgi:polyisoprenoid-binding protein YceI